ncbi:hypothetical protein BDV27DRAFT_137512 [Aspergillus caelatus]|uniref:Uncharacterized protein n=1 Tax=Aspergillus caelatus TaxID=61420 RepID=A0A5N6ZLS1_9EURO|nr:uncharacterized protein BDV27DRAFT_137512 [Aspergillus caelatus]KAE8358564.1 hypothetical protein BDV27DRAFT_137512 [Aspergillus caelatus]
MRNTASASMEDYVMVDYSDNSPGYVCDNQHRAATYEQKERRYFDSGDLALSAAEKMTDDGPIQTGTAHPIRDSISRLYAPRDVSGESQVQEMIDSHLHRQINSVNKMQKPKETI